jgi:hypothetical protein
MPGPDAVDLYLAIDPAAGTVQPSYSVITNGVAGPRTNVGGTMSVPASWFGGTTGLAVGIISTSAGAGPEFPATWDSIEVVPDNTDTSAPLVKKPAQSLVGSSVLGASTVPVKLSWSATDSESGIARYELQQSEDGGPYTPVALPSETATTTTVSLQAGKSYSFRARAQDQAGNWSGWKPGPKFRVDFLQESDGAIVYNGVWNAESLSGALGGGVRYASASGDSAKLTFDGGLNVGWVAPKGADRGIAEVWVDGVRYTSTRDLYSSTAQQRKMIHAKNSLNATQQHTLEVRLLGTKNAKSSGTRVDVDAFVVLRSVP